MLLDYTKALGHGKIVVGNGHVWAGTGNGIVELTNKSLDEILSSIYAGGHFSNPNLLDNWYFGNPVNQRGKSMYTYSTWDMWAIDRWQISNLTLTVSANGYISLQNLDTAPDKYCEFSQCVEAATWAHTCAGQSITMSMLYRSSSTIRFYARFESIGEDPIRRIEFDNCADPMSSDWNLVSYTFTIPSEQFHILKTMVGMGRGIKIDIRAIKLEFGNRQTLAHLENGVWVLNEIPDYAEELNKCQYYYQELNPYGNGVFAPGFGMATSISTVVVHIPIHNMAKYPKVAICGLYKIIPGNYPVTGICPERYSNRNTMAVRFETSATTLTANNFYYVVADNDPETRLNFSVD